MDRSLIYAGAVSGGIYLGSSVYKVPAGEMMEVMLLEKHFTTLGPGFPYILPLGLFRTKRFPTLQIPLMLHVKIPSADANRADFYNDDGSRLTIASFSDEERTAIMDDPLSHRSMIVVEVTILYEFVKSELYSMLTTIGDMEKLGERLGFSIKTALEGLFGRVTINTALEQKDVLSDIFYTRVRRITLESSNRPLGIRILQSFIGPIELDPDIIRANTAAAAAFARKKEIITLAQARKEELSLEGAGRAEAVGALEKYTKTEEGKKAADLDISRQIYQGVSKVIIAPPGIAGLSATLGQTLSSTL